MSPPPVDKSVKYCEITLTSIVKDVYESAMLVKLASGDWVIAQENHGFILLQISLTHAGLRAEKVWIFGLKIQFIKSVTIKNIKFNNI